MSSIPFVGEITDHVNILFYKSWPDELEAEGNIADVIETNE